MEHYACVFMCLWPLSHYVERGEGQSFLGVKQPSPSCAFAPTHIAPWCGRCGGVYSACTARSCYFISDWLVHWKFFLGCSGMIVNPPFFSIAINLQAAGVLNGFVWVCLKQEFWWFINVFLCVSHIFQLQYNGHLGAKLFSWVLWFP